MAPIYVKGGLWSNVEDEILKAAVSKYGLNQWSRVASLLTKKSAKQAKSRWFEWLNPKINKLEWSRQEDEKLLNLVKVLSNQWRMVASIMGRSATDCTTRYEKLLNQVQDQGEGKGKGESDEANGDGSDLAEFGLMGAGVEAMPSTGNQLPGVEYAFESLPAIPDDIDDEHREMLIEARSRLANTQGKKAKRKARERMLQESRRLALLQKRREFKAAGINISLKLKNKKIRQEFDYNSDIPHEKLPQIGLHDTSQETDLADVEKSKLISKINHLGLTLYDKRENKEKTKSKDIQLQNQNAKRQLEMAADSINHYEAEKLKKRKLNLPKFDDNDDIVTDLDNNIEQSAKELIAKKAHTTSALIGLTEEEKESLEDTQPKNNLIPSVIPTSSSLSKKQILKIFNEQVKKLPKPKNEVGIILPSFDPNEALINLNLEKSHQGEELRNLELLTEIEQQQAKLRRSQVVQRGLSIPNPEKIRRFSTSNNLQYLIAQEFEKLIKSDYRKYVDTSYKAKYLEDLDEATYQQVMTEIKEIEAKDLENERTKQLENLKNNSLFFTLPDSLEVCETLISKLHEYHKTSTEKHDTMNIHMKDIYEQEQKLIDDIMDKYNQAYEINQDIHITSSIIDKERSNFNIYTDKLRRSVDEIAKQENVLKNQLRQLTTGEKA